MCIYDIAKELEQKYGVGESRIRLSIHYIQGMYLQLIDFDMDGAEELLAVYLDFANTDAYSENYVVSVYTWDG